MGEIERERGRERDIDTKREICVCAYTEKGREGYDYRARERSEEGGVLIRGMEREEGREREGERGREREG